MFVLSQWISAKEHGVLETELFYFQELPLRKEREENSIKQSSKNREVLFEDLQRLSPAPHSPWVNISGRMLPFRSAYLWEGIDVCIRISTNHAQVSCLHCCSISTLGALENIRNFKTLPLNYRLNRFWHNHILSRTLSIALTTGWLYTLN